jgi:hypothetical protein
MTFGYIKLLRCDRHDEHFMSLTDNKKPTFGNGYFFAGQIRIYLGRVNLNRQHLNKTLIHLQTLQLL